ncbi:MAG: methyltransferase domain-containing protein [Desulfobacteraceae bacterium]|nr:methyltransferase domain-containing protein [Desulfobacteraceae bacterium]
MAGLVDWKLIQEISSQKFQQESPQKADKMWSKAAPMYNFMSGLEEKYTLKQVDEMLLEKTDTVLDIGCGIGRLSVPVAKRVKTVTSIDIAEGMLEYCRNNSKAAGLNNITIKKLDWKAAKVGIDVLPHDVAFASRSVGLRDIEKLNKIARKYVFLLSFAQYPSLRHVSLEILNGIRKKEDSEQMPSKTDWRTTGYNVTFNILYDMGIDPMVKVITDGFERTYENREAAYNDLRFLIREINSSETLTDEQESIFRKNVDLHLTKKANGKWQFLRETKTYIIGWKTKNLD